MNSDQEALLAAIRANPADDLPRLVYADWLDEHAGFLPCWQFGYEKGEHHELCAVCQGAGEVSNGFRERAELIRVQCRISTLDGWAFLPQDGHDWVAERDALWKVERYWIETNRRKIRELIGPDIGLLRQGYPNNLFPVAMFSRGFIEQVRMFLQDCINHLPTLVRSPYAAITRVWVTDREPQPYTRWYGWIREILVRDDLFSLPEVVWASLTGGKTRPSIGEWIWKDYPTRELAEKALSDALLRLAWGANP